MEELGRFDIGALESGVNKLESGYKAVKGAQQLAAKSNEEASSKGGDVDPLERILKAFCLEAEDQIPGAAKSLAEAKAFFTSTAKMFGETDTTIAKMKPEAFLKDFLSFIKIIDAKRRAKEEKLAREQKKKKGGGDVKKKSSGKREDSAKSTTENKVVSKKENEPPLKAPKEVAKVVAGPPPPTTS